MSGASLILVRHGRPAIDPDTPPTTWPLCPEGREAVEALAGKIAAYRPIAVAASPEPKARETADIIAARLGLPVDVDLAGALARHKGRPLVAVTHGTVLSLYVARLLDLDAHDLWRNLHTPDAFVLDAQGGLVERIS